MVGYDMSAVDVFEAAAQARLSIKVVGDTLVLAAPSEPAADLLALLRRHKTEILRLHHDHAAWSEEDWQALFDERAGISEFDGGLPRAEAEERARQEVEALRQVVENTSDA